MSKDLTQYLSTKEAAEKMGVTQNHVTLLLERGKIKGRKIGNSWLAYIPSIETYNETKSKRGRPSSAARQLQEAD